MSQTLLQDFSVLLPLHAGNLHNISVLVVVPIPDLAEKQDLEMLTVY